MNEQTIAILGGVIGAVTGIAGMILGIMSYLHNRIDAVNAYFDYDRNPDFIAGRRAVFNLEDGRIIQSSDSNDMGITIVLNAFQHWGVLVKKHQLPFWVFTKTPSGITVVRTYEKLKPTIEARRKNNSLYAKQYKYLYERIKKSRYYRKWLTEQQDYPIK